MLCMHCAIIVRCRIVSVPHVAPLYITLALASHGPNKGPSLTFSACPSGVLSPAPFLDTGCVLWLRTPCLHGVRFHIRCSTCG